MAVVMRRRNFLATTPLITTMSAQEQTKTPAIIELRYFRVRNATDNPRPKLAEFLGKTVAPAMGRLGCGPVGLFSNLIAADGPVLLLVAQHASIAAFEQCWQKLNYDEEVGAGARTLLAAAALPFQRMEVQLLRGFPGFPAIEVPATAEKRAPRVFELRTYESNTPATLARKIKMFEDGEIDIFRKSGLTPVFFGETIVGPKMPNLTYMVAVDSLAARETNWRAFATSAEWKKMSSTPGLSDGEIVCNISNAIFNPLAGSQLR
jgi:hypothetical protein